MIVLQKAQGTRSAPLDLNASFVFGGCALAADACIEIQAGGNCVLVAVKEGVVTVALDQTASRLDFRSCALFAGEDALKLRCETAARVLWCRSPGGSSEIGLVPSNELPEDWVTLSYHLETLLELGQSIEPERSGTEGRLRDAIGVAAFSAFSARASVRGAPSAQRTVWRVQDHVEKHFGRPWNLRSLADTAGVSREYLNVAFRKYVGSTPMRYVWAVRTRQAVALVEATGLSLESIADRCGYKSPFHLSREIKKLTGRTPRDIRRDAKDAWDCRVLQSSR